MKMLRKEKSLKKGKNINAETFLFFQEMLVSNQ